MKNLSHLSAFVLMTIILTLFFSCEDWFEDNNCDETKMPHISKTFLISVQVKYQDNVPFDGKVDYQIYKETCEGETKGVLNAVCGSDGNGLYKANYEPLYSYYNKDDKVIFGFIAHYEVVYPTGGNLEKTTTVSYSYNYQNAESASDEYDEITKTLHLTIPTNSDGTEGK